MKIYIKNMVCQGTRKFVLMEIKKLGLKLSSFIAGELDFQKILSPSEKESVELSLKKYGLELMFDKPENRIPYSLYHPDFEAAAEGISEDVETEVPELLNAG
jgi:hypothetical protein